MLPPENIHYIIYPYTDNNEHIQNITSSACGYYCIAFIMVMNEPKIMTWDLIYS
jgi:hypothetical protein